MSTALGTVVQGDYAFPITKLFFAQGKLWIEAVCYDVVDIDADTYYVHGIDGELVYSPEPIPGRFKFISCGMTTITIELEINQVKRGARDKYDGVY